MKLWFIPQISEHWPATNPERFALNVVVFRRPGIESTFSPSEGMAQEWITSLLVVIARIHMFLGAMILFVTSSKRSFVLCFMKLS